MQESKASVLSGETSSQAPSYASPKLLPTHSLTYSLTGVRCRATSVAKKLKIATLNKTSFMVKFKL